MTTTPTTPTTTTIATTTSQPMTESDRVNALALCVMASMADGGKSDSERNHLRDMIASLGENGSNELATLYGKAAMGQLDAAPVGAKLSSPAVKESAFQMAVLVCEADGGLNDAETSFLQNLQRALGIGEAAASLALGQADDMLAVNLATPPAAVAAMMLTPPPLPVPASAAGSSSRSIDPATSKEIDAAVMKYSVLNAALELLPQNLATAAIIPLQVKMVYGIGGRYGYSLDTGHIKDFLATIGIGATSQVLESYARRMLGGLIGTYGGSLGSKIGGLLGGSIGATVAGGSGKVAGSAVEWGAGPIMTFATTYAIGQVAKAYYAGGRTLSTDMLRRIFTEQSQQASSMYETYRPQIEQQAKGVNPAQLLAMVRGK